MIDDIVDYGNVSTGIFAFNYEKFNLLDLLNDALILINIQADMKGIRIELSMDPKIPRKIKSDPNRIR